MVTSARQDPLAFLAGGGEMGARIRDFDWAGNVLGPPERWPQSLKTAVRIMLTSRQPIWIGWGRELIYLYNDPYQSIIGGKHPRALGQPTAVVWHEIWDEIGPLLATAMMGDEGTYTEAQLLIMERNGYPEETYYTFSYSPIPDDSGDAGGIICANTDDTQRVIGERQLVLLRELAARATDARGMRQACEWSAHALATDPRDLPFALIYMAEADGQSVSLMGVSGIDRGHSAAPELVALDQPAVWPFADVFRGQRTALVDRLDEIVGEALPRGTWERPPTHVAVLPIQATGEGVRGGVLVVGLNPFRLFDDSYQRFLTLVENQIAASVAHAVAYDEEKRRAEVLAQLDRTKTAFFSNVSHEFRTPLTLMLGPLDDLIRGAPTLPEAQEQARVAHRNALRLLKLVNSLLDFSRLEAGRVEALYEPLNLAELTTDLASTFRSAMERAGLRFVVDCPVMTSAVYVDREMWEKIVLNLLSNAFKFTFEGEIVVTLREHRDTVTLTVRDSGTGISPQDLPRVFERFRRVENARARTHEGTGIGLAMVSELVKLHGGHVTLTSELGRGSTFEVTLPTGQAHLPADRVVPSRGRSREIAQSVPFVEEALSWLPASGPARISSANGALLSDLPDQLPDTMAASTVTRILVADDNADMRDYVARLLGGRWSVETVPDGREALARALADPPDLLVTDVMMPGLDGFGLLRALRADPRSRDLPIILLSARAGEESRVEGLRGGADDYLVKPFSGRELVARVESSLSLARVRREAAAIEHALRAEAETREQEFVSLAENLPDLIARFDRELRHVYVNRAIAEMTGRPVEFYLGRHIADTGGPPELLADWCRIVAGVFESGSTAELDFEFPAPPPLGKRWFNTRFVPERGPDGTVASVISIARDVTAQRHTEERLRQAAKMEAIGRLAGGIAHDFNNQLLGVSGFTAFVSRDPGLGSRSRQDLDEILKAAERMAGLTRQLLAFSRQQVLIPETLDLNAAVADGRSLLQRLIGTHIEIVLDLLPEALWVKVDRAQLLQVLMNLAINARDAMPNGGLLALRTGAREVGSARPIPGIEGAVEAGSYAVLTVADGGAGISAADLPHVFEPFFTTKAVGQGTGLGLATVHGIVSQSHGYIGVESELGKGTTFTVVLPRAERPAAEVAPAKPSPGASGAPGRVLVVDDEEVVRTIITRTLRDEGYEVVDARNGQQALECLTRLEGNVDLILSDIVMPGLSARELGERFAADFPGVPLAWMSGYPRDSFAHLSPTQPFVQKPAPPEVLLATVASLVAQGKRSRLPALPS